MNTYFKSFVTLGHEPVTTTYNPKDNSRTICQTLGEVLESGKIEPNTTHSQLDKRLCVSFLTQGYEGTYRPEGLIFQTEQNPDYHVPFDLMALTSSKTFTSSDYYKPFLRDSEQFQYKTLSEMLEHFPISNFAIQALNKFRQENGLTLIDERSMGYNECCFTQKVIIRPRAIIGTSQTYQELALRYNVPLYRSVEEYKRSN